MDAEVKHGRPARGKLFRLFTWVKFNGDKNFSFELWGVRVEASLNCEWFLLARNRLPHSDSLKCKRRRERECERVENSMCNKARLLIEYSIRYFLRLPFIFLNSFGYALNRHTYTMSISTILMFLTLYTHKFTYDAIPWDKTEFIRFTSHTHYLRTNLSKISISLWAAGAHSSC